MMAKRRAVVMQTVYLVFASWLAAVQTPSAQAAASQVLVAQQAPTSRTIFFNGIQTTLLPSGTQDLAVHLWDDPSAGNLLFTESQPGVSDDANSTISVVYGSQTAGGLDPAVVRR